MRWMAMLEFTGRCEWLVHHLFVVGRWSLTPPLRIIYRFFPLSSDRFKVFNSRLLHREEIAKKANCKVCQGTSYRAVAVCYQHSCDFQVSTLDAMCKILRRCWSRMLHCRDTLAVLEEILERDPSFRGSIHYCSRFLTEQLNLIPCHRHHQSTARRRLPLPLDLHRHRGLPAPFLDSLEAAMRPCRPIHFSSCATLVDQSGIYALPSRDRHLQLMNIFDKNTDFGAQCSIQCPTSVLFSRPLNPAFLPPYQSSCLPGTLGVKPSVKSTYRET